MIQPPYNLRCEYLINPIEIDTLNPRFSWLLQHQNRNQNQSAFHIIVSSNQNKAKSEIGDIWDSGKVISNNNINISYEGKLLKSNEFYYWRVKWWDKNDQPSVFSEVAIFGMALLNESDWKAKWISRKEYTDKALKEKFQYISSNSD